jgi:universal stress protein E
MKNFKIIVIKVSDMSNPEVDIAVLRGVELAKTTGAKIVLFDVVELCENMLGSYSNIFTPSELSDLFVAQRLEQLSDLAQKLQSIGLEASSRVSKGKYFIEIVKAMIVEKGDLLIKAANTSKNGFDSNDFHIMRKCPKPVWLIKANIKDAVNRIVAAVDLSMESHSEGRAQNRMIMDIATFFSHHKNSKLTILSCWSLYGEAALRHGAFTRVSTIEIEDMLSNEEREHKECLRNLANEYREFSFDLQLEKGSPKLLIPEYVNNNNIDIVVMGTIGRSGIPGYLIGNTSESVLQAISSSVITLKPAAWVSPIH